MFMVRAELKYQTKELKYTTLKVIVEVLRVAKVILHELKVSSSKNSKLSTSINSPKKKLNH